MADAAPPYPPNILDADLQGVLGRPLPRADGPLKVTGRAVYAYERAGFGKTAYGCIVGAAVATGRITRIETGRAAQTPGVLLVLTYRNAPHQAPYATFAETGFSSYSVARPVLDSDRVTYVGQPVALVVAESFEAARHAASLVDVTYARGATPVARLRSAADAVFAPRSVRGFLATDSEIGDFEGAFARAPVQIDATYETPIQHHNALEPNTTLAVWRDDAVTLYVSAQLPVDMRDAVAATLLMPKEKVRIVCKFVGGAFGGKLATEADTVLAALAARELGRPVKIALTRPQTFVNATHRTETIQRVRLGATADGRLLALGHEATMHTSRFDEFTEQVVDFSRHLYAAPNRRTRHRLAPLDLPQSGDMRAPGEAPGLLAFEQAMDELAYATGLDPLELRLRNEPAVHPETGKPFSSRHLVECYRDGARRFDWGRRPRQPATLRDGPWLVGFGMATAIRINLVTPAQARVRLTPDGRLLVQTAMTDLGTGTYTVLGQVAAEAMGLPFDRVTVEIGDSALPPTAGSGGSWGASSSGSAVYEACLALRAKLAQAGGLAGPESLTLRNGQVGTGAQTVPLERFLATHAPDGLEAEGAFQAGPEAQAYSQNAYGACFAEVGVDINTGEPRLRRLLGVFAAGRILNARTAHSQALGGLIWGIGAALMEETLVDDRLARFMNNDLAGYHVAAHADAVGVEAVFLPEIDDKANPLKSKGIGELGICGAGAAIANAIYNACGVRVRRYPITLDKLILDPAFPTAR